MTVMISLSTPSVRKHISVVHIHMIDKGLRIMLTLELFHAMLGGRKVGNKEIMFGIVN